LQKKSLLGTKSSGVFFATLLAIAAFVLVLDAKHDNKNRQ